MGGRGHCLEVHKLCVSQGGMWYEYRSLFWAVFFCAAVGLFGCPSLIGRYCPRKTGLFAGHKSLEPCLDHNYMVRTFSCLDYTKRATAIMYLTLLGGFCFDGHEKGDAALFEWLY